MPFKEAPSYTSMRVQKAYRLNGLEDSRLTDKLHGLEKEKLHGVRLVNQDIRLINLTLEHIQTNSGSSREGIPPHLQTLDKGSKNNSRTQLRRTKSAFSRRSKTSTPSIAEEDEKDDEDDWFTGGSRQLRPKSGWRITRPPSGGSTTDSEDDTPPPRPAIRPGTSNAFRQQRLQTVGDRAKSAAPKYARDGSSDVKARDQREAGTHVKRSSSALSNHNKQSDQMTITGLADAASKARSAMKATSKWRRFGVTRPPRKLYGDEKSTFLLGKKKDINSERQQRIRSQFEAFCQRFPCKRFDALEPLPQSDSLEQLCD